MKVDLIKKQLSHLNEKLGSDDEYSESYKWESLNNYTQNWDLSALDLINMYDNSFKSNISNRLWFADQYEPKRMMLEFIKMQPHFVMDMFRDLLNDKKDLMMRINRFIYHCDDLLRMLQKKDDQYYSHFHSDYRMISVYLTFHDPEKYTIYDYSAFKNYMKNIGAQKVPMENELPKFFTLMKSLYTNFILKDETLLKTYETIFKEEQIKPQLNMLMAHDVLIY